jgi:hypothetical protein
MTEWDDWNLKFNSFSMNLTLVINLCKKILFINSLNFDQVTFRNRNICKVKTNIA